MDKRDKEYYRELKAIQNEYTPSKWEARNKYNWKKEWGPFIKYDADWDSFYLVQLILYKLEKMYIGLDNYSDEVRESLDPKLVKIREVIDLGKKIQTYDYSKEYSAWGDDHCAHVILIHKRGDYTRNEPLHKIVCWRDSENSEDVENRLEQFFGRKKIQQWAEENGYDMKDLQVSYSGEWDSEDNYKVWKKLMKKAQKAEQDDIDKFFKLIAKNYKSWWW